MQVKVGPSDLGNPCPKCLGRKLAGAQEEGRDFSLYPWLGTAVHKYLEDMVFQSPEYQHEQKLYCGTIPDYGDVNGTADLIRYIEPSDGLNKIGDWKIVGLKKIKAYRVKGPPSQYRYQSQIYARGCELRGTPVDSIAIVFIPRDSGNVNDIWIHEEAYQPAMAEAAFARAAKLVQVVKESGWEDLPSDDDCYNCNRVW